METLKVRQKFKPQLDCLLSFNSDTHCSKSGRQVAALHYIEKWSHCVPFVFSKLRDKTYLRFTFDSPSFSRNRAQCIPATEHSVFPQQSTVYSRNRAQCIPATEHSVFPQQSTVYSLDEPFVGVFVYKYTFPSAFSLLIVSSLLVDIKFFRLCMCNWQWNLYSDTSANEDNSFRAHIR